MHGCVCMRVSMFKWCKYHMCIRRDTFSSPIRCLQRVGAFLSYICSRTLCARCIETYSLNADSAIFDREVSWTSILLLDGYHCLLRGATSVRKFSVLPGIEPGICNIAN